MRVAIFGQAKTGTSALYAKLREALPADTDCYFEPHRQQVARLRRLQLGERLGLRRKRALLAKFLPFHPGDAQYIPPFGAFDHAIQIVRDPRDRVISALLYWSYNTPLAHDDAAAQAFIARIAAKERDSASIALIDLIGDFMRLQGLEFVAADWLAAYSKRAVTDPLAFADGRPELVDYRYEALVEQDFAAVTAATGLTLHGEADVGPQLRRVVRRKGFGDWCNWFTPVDVAAFQPVMQPYLARFYPEADWDLAATPAIDPAHGSRYVRRVIDEARGLSGLAPLPNAVN